MMKAQIIVSPSRISGPRSRRQVHVDRGIVRIKICQGAVVTCTRQSHPLCKTQQEDAKSEL